MEALEIARQLRLLAIIDPIPIKNKGLNALSWQILYDVTRYLEYPDKLEVVRYCLKDRTGKSLAMNSRRIERYLKFYDKSNSQTIRASNQT